MIDLIKKNLANYSDSNWAEFQASLAPDAIYEELATSRRVQGVEDYMKEVRRWKTAFPDLKATVLDCIEAGNKVYCEVDWIGTHTGPLEGPLGMIPPTNKRGSVRAALVFTIKNNKIVEQHHYFDLMTVLRQLGVSPPLGVPAAGAQKPAPAREKH